jgi:ABC-2 type transport system permease protein
MRIIFTLVKKDLANFLRNRAAVVLTFVVPVALIYIFGQVFGLNRKDTGPNGISLGVVSESDSPAAQKLVDALKAEKAFNVFTTREDPDKTKHPLTEADVRARIRNRQLRFAVVIPKDAVSEATLGLHLKILSDPRNEIETQLVNGLLQKTIFSNVPELLGQSLQTRAKSYLGAAGLDRFNGALATAVSSAFGGDPEKIKERFAAGTFGFDNLNPAPAKPADPSLRRLDTPAPDTAPATPPATAPSALNSQPSAKKSAASDIFSRIVKIENEQVVGKDVKSPDATRIVGGWAMMFLLFALSNGAAAFFDEKIPASSSACWPHPSPARTCSGAAFSTACCSVWCSSLRFSPPATGCMASTCLTTSRSCSSSARRRPPPAPPSACLSPPSRPTPRRREGSQLSSCSP